MELSPADWIQYGVLGLVLLSLIVGWLDLGRTTAREAKRADRLEEENARLRQHTEDQVIPLLVRAMDLLDRQARRGDGP